MTEKLTFPKIGMRIIKSAAAVFLCFIIDDIRNGAGIVFYSQLSALWCMQVDKTATIKNAKQRMIGTVIGTFYGFIFIVFRTVGRFKLLEYEYISEIIISLLIIAVIYTTVAINKKQASYFSCVVFLSIVVNHIDDLHPYLFVLNRFLDTAIGIIIGVFVNISINPKIMDRN